MNKNELWSLVHSCFDEDDGSFPSFEIDCLDVQSISDLYLLLRTKSKMLTNNPTFWDVEQKIIKTLDAVENAATLVALFKAEPFYFCVENLIVDNITLPCLGIYVFQESVAIDYKMGSDWNSDTVYGLFLFLKKIVTKYKGSKISPSESEGPPNPEIFMEAFKKFYSSEFL